MESNAFQRLQEVVDQVARMYFAGRPDFPEVRADLLSRSWEFTLTAGENATVHTVVGYAARHVRAGRHFSGSIRGIEARRKDGPHYHRIDIDLMELPDDHQRPAASAILRIDFTEFRKSLNDRQREVLDAVLMGDSTSEIADRLDRSLGLISQIRRLLYERLQTFLS